MNYAKYGYQCRRQVCLFQSGGRNNLKLEDESSVTFWKRDRRKIKSSGKRLNQRLNWFIMVVRNANHLLDLKMGNI